MTGTIHAGIVALIAVVAGVTLVAGERSQGFPTSTAPDGTPISCNFALALQGGDDPTGSAKFCTTYDFNLFRHPYNAELSTLEVHEKATRRRMVYLISDIPLSKAAPDLPGPPESIVLLLDNGDQPIPVVVLRRPQKIDIMLGARRFQQQFQYRLRPRQVRSQ